MTIMFKMSNSQESKIKSREFVPVGLLDGKMSKRNNIKTNH